MRIPFNLPNPNFEDGARVKFHYSSPELKQNIEISLDGDETTIEELLHGFQRFIAALGVYIPDNVELGFVERDEEDDEEGDEDEKIDK